MMTKMTVVWGPRRRYCAVQPLNRPNGPSSFTMTTAQFTTELYFRRPALTEMFQLCTVRDHTYTHLCSVATYMCCHFFAVQTASVVTAVHSAAVSSQTAPFPL